MGYAPPGTNPTELIALAEEADRLGYHSAWAAESWGTDVVTVLSWLGARTSQIKLGAGIMQIPARTPAMTAMTAATLDLMSGGRVPARPRHLRPAGRRGLARPAVRQAAAATREYVEIVRAAIARQVVEFHGEEYEIPYGGEDATGLGKPLKLMMHPTGARSRSTSPRSGRRTSRSRSRSPTAGSRSGSRRRGKRRLPAAEARRLRRRRLRRAGRDLRRPPGGPRLLKPHLALYVGGMGAKGRTTTTRSLPVRLRGGGRGDPGSLPRRQEDGGDRQGADALVDEVALVGRRSAWRSGSRHGSASPVTTLLIQAHDAKTLRTMAELVL